MLDKGIYVAFIVIIIFVILGTFLWGVAVTLAIFGTIVGIGVLGMIKNPWRAPKKQPKCKPDDTSSSTGQSVPLSYAATPNDIGQVYSKEPTLDVDSALTRKNYFMNRQAKQCVDRTTRDKIAYAKTVFDEELNYHSNKAWWDNDSLDLQLQHTFTA